jgi:hypothetical protein
MNMTLGEFQRRYGVHKGTISKRARELGFDTSAGLTPEAVDVMRQEFGVTEPVAHTAPVEVVDSSRGGALAYYGGGGMVGSSTRRLSLGEEVQLQRVAQRENRRQTVVESFGSINLTREERRLLIQQAALNDADDDAETYAAVYQARLDQNLQRHAVATGLVMGKDVDAVAGGAA